MPKATGVMQEPATVTRRLGRFVARGIRGLHPAAVWRAMTTHVDFRHLARRLRAACRGELATELAPAPVIAGPGAAPAGATPSDPAAERVRAQRAELRARLLVHDPATQVVRNLYTVHNALRQHGGWPGVEALPAKVIGRALAEAEILAQVEPSDLLESIMACLRDALAASERREADEALASDWARAPMPEVSDTNYDEYELMERSWAGTVPARLQFRRTA